MNYYDTFLKNTPNPKEKWDKALQEAVNQRFINSSTYQANTVEIEEVCGTDIYKTIPCRVVSLIDAKTGQRINDDYKNIVFPDLSFKPSMGTKFRFDNNIWLVFTTDNVMTPTSNVYVRRCNSVVNFEDKYGNIHNEPCYIDYKVNETQIYRGTKTEVPNGRLWIQCQYNDYTKNIRVDDRYIFGSSVYKVRNFTDYDRRNTFEKDSVCTVSFYVDLDPVSDDDNFELGVANYKCYNYKINLDYNSINNVVDFISQIDYNVTLDDTIVNEEVIWESDNENIAVIDKDTGVYKLISIGECKIIARMKNKTDIIKEVNVSVKQEINDVFVTIITPNINYVKLNQVQAYEIYEYKNNVKIDTKFSFEFLGVSNKNYRYINDDNGFSIVNLKQSLDKLTVECKNLRNNEITSINIELGGII